MATIWIGITIETASYPDDNIDAVRNDIVTALDTMLGFGFENVLISSKVKE